MLPNYSINRVGISKRGYTQRPGRGRTCAVCSLKSRKPRSLNSFSNSSFRLGVTSSPRRRNAAVACRRRLNDSFDRHLLFERGWPLSHTIYEQIKPTGTDFIRWYKSPSLIEGSFSNMLLTTSIIAKVQNGLTQDPDQFLSWPGVSQNNLFARRYRECSARRSCLCPSSYCPPTSVDILRMAKGRSVPGEIVDLKDKGSSPVPHQGHP
jgi:hypothetical protein